jgi:transposase
LLEQEGTDETGDGSLVGEDADLPMAGWTVRLRLEARRFRCDAAGCRRRVFTERFDPEVLAPWARRTNRLDELVHHLAIALGGRPASRLARRLMLPVSKDALLRVVRRRGSPRLAPPTVIGIDDWALCECRSYSPQMCRMKAPQL